MLRGRGLVRALLLGAVLSGAGLVSTGTLAQDACCEGGSATGANLWTTGNGTSANWPAPWPTGVAAMDLGNAPPSETGWWTHGEIEFGGRGFTSAPPRNGSGAPNSNVWQQGQNLANYYEYSDIAPGVFGGGHFATGSNDGLYEADVWANNIGSFVATDMADLHGFSDQAYLLNLSKIGQQYLTFQWDQTPHVYSTSAQTPYLGVGTNNLTLPAGAQQPFNAKTPGSFLTPFLHQQDIGIERNTASVNYRWTPTDAWDVRGDYSYMTRTGTIVQGNTGNVPAVAALHNEMITEVPEPVNDNTQNFGANAEYAGTSPWGKKFTAKLAYNGSLYTDNISSYFVQNPWGLGCAGAQQDCPGARISTWPSNQMNGFSGVLATDLPARSRYVGTLNLERMTQNETFLPETDNVNATPSPFGPNWNQVNFGYINGNLGDPTSSLNGQINTVLSDNILTTKINPDLTSKLTYRYYDFDNETPQIVFPIWVSYDQIGSPLAAKCGAAEHDECTISSLTMSYVKQDGTAALNWRPSRQWNFNGEFGWERYDYTETDVNVTNEFSGKLSADWKPVTWLTARASGYYAQRRYDVYDYVNFVRNIQFPTVPGFPGGPETGAWYYSSAYQQFMFDNRDRSQLNFLLDVVAFRGVTITPGVKFNEDYYGLNPLNQYGLSDSRSVSTGVDVAFHPKPDLSIVLSYYRDDYNQELYNQPTPAAAYTSVVATADKTYVNSVTAAVKYAAIPDRLQLDARYELSDGVDEQICTGCSAAVAGFPPAYPNDTTLWQRLDTTATYKFDPTWVHQTGFNGDLKARLRYTWERNSVSNWQNDPVASFNPAINGGYGIYLASDNPNYNVQMLAASLIASW
jgi:MtrB/PioB family decaheme-associated outer membrane protein